MKSDSLEDVLKKRLQDFEPTGSVPSWQQMQRRMQLHANAHPEQDTAPKRSLFRRIGYAAAAAVLLSVVGTGVYRMTRPATYTGLTALEKAAAPVAAVPGKETKLSATERPNDAVLTKLLQSARSIEVITPETGTGVTLAAANDSHTGASGTGSAIALPNGDQQIPAPAAEQRPAEEATSSVSSRFSKNAEAYRKLFDTPVPGTRKPHGRWMATAFANASTFSSASGGNGIAPAKFTALYDGTTDPAYSKSGIPEFSRGILNHKFPVTVGLNVRKNLAPRVGLETGLVYSYLSSQAEFEGAFSYRYSQKVHYLGIPLSVTYSVFDNKRFDIYFIGGFMAEKAISARGTTKIYNGSTLTSSGTDKLSAKGVFWSAHLGTGIGYNFVPHFGLFAEPQVNYYFRNDNQPPSYRTENPWNINVRMGLRYNF